MVPDFAVLGEQRKTLDGDKLARRELGGEEEMGTRRGHFWMEKKWENAISIAITSKLGKSAFWGQGNRPRPAVVGGTGKKKLEKGETREDPLVTFLDRPASLPPRREEKLIAGSSSEAEEEARTEVAKDCPSEKNIVFGKATTVRKEKKSAASA